MTVRAAGWVWLVAGAVYIICETVAAQPYPDYSYARDYISALGVPRVSPSASLMNAGAFVLHGVLFATAGVLLTRSVRQRGRAWIAFAALTVTNGVGNVLVGLFHAGASPLHGFGALLAIIGGNAAMILAGRLFRDVGVARWLCVAGRIAGVVGIASFGALLAIADQNTGVEGAVERGSVYTIIAWDVAVGLVLLSRRRSPHSV
ncbi:DUF998 domain-containing protein [uncultured Williamsia sp.]|uniref:DUF998 domain-containing protein n=1 Tax=uncultured Williamsia sp. TaxID=259311 RepID=UPI0026364233|nr:DUF998 domain-containing protein [uncultured Williamsia sp.]